jgi:hypothetical protein
MDRTDPITELIAKKISKSFRVAWARRLRLPQLLPRNFGSKGRCRLDYTPLHRSSAAPYTIMKARKLASATPINTTLIVNRMSVIFSMTTKDESLLPFRQNGIAAIFC